MNHPNILTLFGIQEQLKSKVTSHTTTIESPYGSERVMLFILGQYSWHNNFYLQLENMPPVYHRVARDEDERHHTASLAT